ncbi:MAG: P-loop NTPase fold protein [Acidobacteriota bacterium]
MHEPEGTVLAINGPWGSGKSSAVNLVRYHLRDDEEAGKISTVLFETWWFKGEEALALAFFQQLFTVLDSSASDALKKELPELTKKMLKLGPLLGHAVNLGTVGIGGPLITAGAEFLDEMISTDTSIESQHKELSKLLKKEGKRYLVIIDDMDRLSPDEVLLVLRNWPERSSPESADPPMSISRKRSSLPTADHMPRGT